MIKAFSLPGGIVYLIANLIARYYGTSRFCLLWLSGSILMEVL